MKQLPNEVLVRHSLWEWIRIFDRMRADHYAFLNPDKSFSRLEDLLKIKTFMPESDRNFILRQTLFDDSSSWSYPYNSVFLKITSACLHNGTTWAEKYPEIHGQNSILNSTSVCWNNFSTSTLHNKSWSQIIMAIYEYICSSNGFVYLNASNGIVGKVYNDWFSVYGRECREHNGTTPIGEWEEFSVTNSSEFGCWQKIIYNQKNDKLDYRVDATSISRLKIENFNPPFDFPYRLVIAGHVSNVIQFDGMGFVEYPGCYNVIFDSGPIQGNYTSPLIGIDSIYTSTDLDIFRENKSTGYAGWKIDFCNTFVLPAEGVFPDYF